MSDAMPKLPKPWRTFNIPLYGGSVFIYKSRKPFHSAVKAHGRSIEEDNSCGGRCVEIYKPGVTRYVLGWFTDHRSTLVHELGHLAVFVITNAGMKIEDSGGEAYCYLLSHLYAETA